jgi:hypothetical protein
MKWKFVIIDNEDVVGTNDYDKAVRHLENDYATVINCETGTVITGSDAVDLDIPEQTLYV